MLIMNAVEYRKLQEAFFHNSATHTCFAIFFTIQCTIYCSLRIKKFGILQYVYEYLNIVFPLILAHTILANYIYGLNLIVFLLLLNELRKVFKVKSLTEANVLRTKHIQTISSMRGVTYLITAVCILAVDFQAFPRYLAKTERFGISLMDTGVGCFVLISGLVHKDLRNTRVVSILKSNAKFITVLLLLGIARSVSLKQLDYQEHVTEYGVHWNFFFTIAVCKLLSTLLLFFMNNALALSIITIVCHELLLQNGLQNWVFSDTPREDLISANREGISSSLGYVALYFFAAYVKDQMNNHARLRYQVCAKLVTMIILLCSLFCVTNLYLPASRTLANASYCLFMSSICLIVLTVMYVFEMLCQDKGKGFYFNTPLILSAINKNGLIYFLICNLLTGAVNLSIQTLLVSETTALVILNVYMIITSILIVYLSRTYNLPQKMHIFDSKNLVIL